MRTIAALYILCFVTAPRPSYIIVSGDITCKACVTEIHHYLTQKNKKTNVVIGVEDRGSFIINESKIDYFQRELPKAKFSVLGSKSLFSKNEKYPYVLKIIKKDTVKISYETLYPGEFLNVSAFD